MINARYVYRSPTNALRKIYVRNKARVNDANLYGIVDDQKQKIMDIII